MGAEFNGRCYASAAEAADAYFHSFGPSVVSGATSYATEFTKVADVWRSVGYSIDSAGVWSLRFSTVAQVPTFADCDQSESFVDGMTIGWGIAAAMLAAYSFNLMRRGLGVARL